MSKLLQKPYEWQDEHAELLGREVRRTIYAGQPIKAQDTRAARLVKRNQLVTLKYMNGPLEISLSGGVNLIPAGSTRVVFVTAERYVEVCLNSVADMRGISVRS